MLPIIVESALRSAAFWLATWGLLAAVRLRDLRLEKFLWSIAVAVSLAMPALMQWTAIPIPEGMLSVVGGPAVTRLGAGQAAYAPVKLLLFLYLVVTLALLVRLTIGLLMAMRLRHRAQPLALEWAAAMDVRSSAAIRAPSSFGSTVLLPADWRTWSTEKLRTVIAHEQAHIRQFDCYRIWLASLNCALFWFSPCAHLLRRRLMLLTELTSDEEAIARVGDRARYAELLIQLASGAPAPAGTLSMATPSTLSVRLTTLMENDMTIRKLSRASTFGLVTLVALIGATAAGSAPAPKVLTESEDASVRWVSGEPLSKFYPAQLVKNHVEGSVVCRLTIAADGHVTAVKALAQRPADGGFEDAAVAAAKTFRFENKFARPVVKKLMLKFALS